MGPHLPLFYPTQGGSGCDLLSLVPVNSEQRAKWVQLWPKLVGRQRWIVTLAPLRVLLQMKGERHRRVLFLP